MKDITHEILSEVHHLLSIATEEDLRRAANLSNNSPHLRSALESLASEKASTSRRPVVAAATPRVPRKLGNGRKPVEKSGVNVLTRELTRSFEKLGKGEIQEACRSIGLPLTVRVKDARERIVRRAANLLVNMPDAERERVLSEMRIKADTQTEGWVGVIRKGR